VNGQCATSVIKSNSGKGRCIFFLGQVLSQNRTLPSRQADLDGYNPMCIALFLLVLLGRNTPDHFQLCVRHITAGKGCKGIYLGLRKGCLDT